MAIVLSDDGTLDTVLRCEDCSEEFRYTYEPADDDTIHCAGHDDYRDGCADCDLVATEAYEDFVDWAIGDAETEHECSVEQES